jgi:glycosyltransferase involved in cell wall biosynthesis
MQSDDNSGLREGRKTTAEAIIQPETPILAPVSAGAAVRARPVNPEVSGVRIAYLVTRAAPIGGAQIHIRDLAAAVRAQGHAPTVITSGAGPFLDDLRAQQIPIVILKHLSVPIAPLRDLRALREIRTTMMELRPDLIAAHSSKAGVLGRLAGRSLRIPVVFTAHGWAFTPGVPALQASVYRQIERLMGPLTSKIITVSEFDRRLALDAHIVSGDRVVTVHNGIADVPARLRADPGRTPVRLIMVARFGSQKDHSTLLHALAGLQDRSWELDLIGDGPLMTSVESLAARVGLRDRVRFLGQRRDVDQLLAQAQVSLLVTNWEGFPLSILESMRAGLPVVASLVGGIGESVRDGETGYLVPRGGVALLQDRIERLLADPTLRLRLGASGRTRYEQHFTLGHAVAKTLRVYGDVLGEGMVRQTGERGTSTHLTA